VAIFYCCQCRLFEQRWRQVPFGTVVPGQDPAAGGRCVDHADTTLLEIGEAVQEVCRSQQIDLQIVNLHTLIAP
jgi:hypothetical protein